MIEDLDVQSVSTIGTWIEFRLIFSDASSPRDWRRENYSFIRDHLIALIERNSVQNFHILNYFNPSQAEDFIRFRLEASPALVNRIEEEFDQLKQTNLISDYQVSDYSPRRDAEQRIESVRHKLQIQSGTQLDINWRILGLRDGQIQLDLSDVCAHSSKVAAFEVFLSQILGKWTKLFLEEIHSRPDDIWLNSLFIHLLFNSLCFSGPNVNTEEYQLRRMDPI